MLALEEDRTTHHRTRHESQAHRLTHDITIGSCYFSRTQGTNPKESHTTVPNQLSIRELSISSPFSGSHKQLWLVHSVEQSPSSSKNPIVGSEIKLRHAVNKVGTPSPRKEERNKGKGN